MSEAPVLSTELDSRSHMNLVFIGHVDAGKSTTCGSIMYLSGQVDERMVEKLEREAKEKNRDSWFMAYVMDTIEEERSKGITVEVGRAAFTTPNRRFTILDAPGHKNFVPNMIQGASAADVGVLIISARKGEFETGFEKGGQTREHALLAKTLGISRLLVAINKMDDPTVEYRKERYDEISEKLKPYLRSVGYNIKSEDDVIFLPISGLRGDNIKEPIKDPRASWYKGPTLWQILDNTNPPFRDANAALRMPLLEGFKDMGVMAIGKIEQGTMRVGQQYTILPAKIETEVLAIFVEDEEVSRPFANPGENVRVKLKNVEEEQIHKGNVLSTIVNPVPVVGEFRVQLLVVELLEHRPIMTAGYSCVFHCHTLVEECVITNLEEVIDRTTQKKQKSPRFVRADSMVTCTLQTANTVALDSYKVTPQLGRFTLRDEGKTIAIGKIVEVFPDSKPYGKSVADAFGGDK
jgi:peptide chain release factor subunit 3